MSSHATAQYQQDTVVSAEAFSELHNLLADRLTTAKAVREEHAKDVSHHLPHLPACCRIPP